MEIKFLKASQFKIKKMQSGNVPYWTALALVNRGVDDLESYFFKKNIFHYNLLKDIDKGVELIIRNKNKKFFIIADYDCDGATACSVLYKFFKSINYDIHYIVPDRKIHGYGLTPDISQMAKDQGAEVLITVDNGIASIQGVEKAKSLGLEVLITDHHLQGDFLPNADVIINPNRKDCTFPSKNIAGCGVAFYLASALYREHFKDQCKLSSYTDLLDLVAVGTVADVVKLDYNNRWLVKQGMNKMKNNPSSGLAALMEVSKIDKKNLTTQDIGFSIGPKINAAGRIAHMSLGIECLIEENYEKALEKANELNNINKERKDIQDEMLQITKYEKDLEKTISKIIYNPDFHEGVVGIVAGRLKEKYYSPSFVFAKDKEGNLKGSGRSIPNFHIRDALDWVSKKDTSIITKFGGHAMAAGLTIQKDKFEEFKRLFEEVCKLWLKPSDLNQVWEIDAQLSGEQLEKKMAQEISEHVWGSGFPEPIFYGEFEVLDKQVWKNTHIKWTLTIDGFIVYAMHFFAKEIIDADKLALVYKVSLDKRHGFILHIVDCKSI